MTVYTQSLVYTQGVRFTVLRIIPLSDISCTYPIQMTFV